ncbi:MAG: hypothetical protein N2379_05090 [Verrucomicrobiae bacterium]|nr:hypothetical protein [Verrucomicrobiae bacterium]
MRRVEEIEAAIRKLGANEIRALAKWLEGYIARGASEKKPAPPKDVYAKWCGRGRLPVGRTTDEYLAFIRDANSG